MQRNGPYEVLFLPLWYPGEDDPVSGVFIREQAQAVSLFHQVTVLYSKSGRDINRLCEFISDRHEFGIRTVRVGHKKCSIPTVTFGLYMFCIWRFFNELWRTGFRPDLIHAQVFSAGVPAIIIGKKFGIPVVISEHSGSFLLGDVRGRELCKARFALKKADIVLPVSDTLNKAIMDYGIKNSFSVVPNVVNTEVFFPSREEVKTGNGKRVLLVSLLRSHKGVPDLLRALAQLQKKRADYVLDIVGDGPKREKYEGLVESLGLNRFVRFHGLKSMVEVADFIRRCHFMVIPSRSESFGVTAIEAMACGKPVVATRLPEFEMMIGDGKGVLVSPGNVDELADAIGNMLDHYDDYSGEPSYSYARDNFGYEAVGSQLNDIYRKVVKNHAGKT